MIGGVGSTHKVLIGPAIQIWVFSTNEAVSSVTSPALTLVHRVTEVADVDAFGIFVTVVGFVLAWVLWLTHLKKKTAGYRWHVEVKSTYLTATSLRFLFGSYFKERAYLNLKERFWPQCVAFLGTVDFMKSHLMHYPSHYDPLLPLYCSTRYSQLPLITRGWAGRQSGCHSMSS